MNDNLKYVPEGTEKPTLTPEQQELVEAAIAHEEKQRRREKWIKDSLRRYGTVPPVSDFDPFTGR